MKLPSHILNVLPGGKYYELARIIICEPNQELQWRKVGQAWLTAQNQELFFADRDGVGDLVEWRLKPKTQRYRNALLRFNNGNSFVGVINNEETELIISGNTSFVKWLTDWIEYEV